MYPSPMCCEDWFVLIQTHRGSDTTTLTNNHGAPMKFSLRFTVILPVVLCCLSGVQAQDDSTMLMYGRQRVTDKAGNLIVQLKKLHWNPKQTAIVICDMWDDHYCRNAATRVAEMAPHMNRVISEARKRGVLIFHCPSGCMNVYKDTPQRKLAQQAPKVKTKVPLQRWCYLDKKREIDYPVDESEPCDDEKGRERKRFYTRQHAALKIEDGDAVTDSAEAYYLMKQKKIRNVIVMGVHTNMCVLGRPFGIRQMVYQGMNVTLMRDMTDAMYSPKCKPYVSHFRGTELVIEHIEKYWCPTISSTEFTGEPAFRFKEDKRPNVVFVVGGREYDADKSIPPFAHELRDKYGCNCEVLIGRGSNKDGYDMPGLAALKRADLAVLFLRRRYLPTKQMDHLRNYLKAGKPLVALRTTSHGFETKAPEGTATWATFDTEVLGCDYRGHAPGGPGTGVTINPDAKNHPILNGIQKTKWHSSGSLYSADPLDKKATRLLTGWYKDKSQPIAWTRMYGKSRVFYSSLGHFDDFSQPQFRKMLTNAVFWAMNRPVPTSDEPPMKSSKARWPQFRGPGGSGVVADDTPLPTQLHPKKALWRTQLPPGHSSPCVWDDRIFLTGYDKQTKTLETYCLNTNGKLLWKQPAPAEKIERTHKIGNPATPTPTTDGDRVYSYFGSFGLLCYDMSGKLLWKLPLPTQRARFGTGASPILVGKHVILSCEHMPKPYLMAVDGRTGKISWKVEPFLYGDGCCTPALWQNEKHDELVLHTAEKVVSFDADNGKMLWWIPIESTACTSPVIGAGKVYVATWIHHGEADERFPIPSFPELLKLGDKNKDNKISRKEFPDDLSYLKRKEADGIPGSHFKLVFWFRKLDKNQDGQLDRQEWARMEDIDQTEPEHGLIAVNPYGKGDVSKTHIAWKQERYIPEVSSPLYHKGLVYMTRSGGIVTCMDAETGKVHFTKRLGSDGMYFASPSCGDGKIYISSYDGVVSVIAEGTTFRLLSQHSFGERIMSSPALANGRVYIRTEEALYAFGNK